MYKTDLTEYSQSIHVNFHLILQQSDIYISNLFEIGKTITNRAYIILSLLVVVTIGNTIFLIATNNVICRFVAIGHIALLLCCVYLVYTIIKPRHTVFGGFMPEDICTNVFESNNLLFVHIVEQRQEYINMLAKDNKDRAKKIKKAMILFLLYFVQSVAYIIFSLPYNNN